MKIVCSPKGIVDKDRPRQGIMDIADAVTCQYHCFIDVGSD